MTILNSKLLNYQRVHHLTECYRIGVLSHLIVESSRILSGILSHHCPGWWLSLPLWKIKKSVGMMKFPTYGKIEFMFQSPPISYLIDSRSARSPRDSIPLSTKFKKNSEGAQYPPGRHQTCSGWSEAPQKMPCAFQGGPRKNMCKSQPNIQKNPSCLMFWGWYPWIS